MLSNEEKNTLKNIACSSLLKVALAGTLVPEALKAAPKAEKAAVVRVPVASPGRPLLRRKSTA